MENYADRYKDCHWISFEVLEDFMKQCLVNIGIPEDDADIVTDVLIESDKRGIDSHGIGRLKPIYLDRIDAGILNTETKIDVVKDTETTAVLDGNNGMGHVVSKKAMEMAIEKAKTYGMGMVAVRNSTHYGMVDLTIDFRVLQQTINLSKDPDAQ
jgi:L-2-hydroxycarboxylate dehydrogenase (NAD+)